MNSCIMLGKVVVIPEVIIIKKKKDAPEKLALEIFEKIENKFDDLVELTCTIRLLLRRAINKVKTGSSIEALDVVEKEMKKVSDTVKDLSNLTMLDAGDLELLDGSENI